MKEHDSAIRSIGENDTVSIETSMGHSFTGECISRDTHFADPRSGEVRETKIWKFEYDETHLIVSIIDGLKSSPDDDALPRHKQAWITGTETAAGYVSDIKVVG